MVSMTEPERPRMWPQQPGHTAEQVARSHLGAIEAARHVQPGQADVCEHIERQRQQPGLQDDPRRVHDRLKLPDLRGEKLAGLVAQLSRHPRPLALQALVGGGAAVDQRRSALTRHAPGRRAPTGRRRHSVHDARHRQPQQWHGGAAEHGAQRPHHRVPCGFERLEVGEQLFPSVVEPHHDPALRQPGRRVDQQGHPWFTENVNTRNTHSASRYTRNATSTLAAGPWPRSARSG